MESYLPILVFTLVAIGFLAAFVAAVLVVRGVDAYCGDKPSADGAP